MGGFAGADCSFVHDMYVDHVEEDHCKDFKIRCLDKMDKLLDKMGRRPRGVKGEDDDDEEEEEEKKVATGRGKPSITEKKSFKAASRRRKDEMKERNKDAKETDSDEDMPKDVNKRSKDERDGIEYELSNKDTMNKMNKMSKYEVIKESEEAKKSYGTEMSQD